MKRYADYKYSTSPLLDKVPAHWREGPLKYLLRIRGGQDHKAVENDTPTDIPVIGSGGAFSYATDYLYEGESVLLGRKGTIDRPLYVSGKFWTVDTMFYTEILPTANARFAYYLSTTIPFSLYSTNTALPSMSQFDLANHSVPIPSTQEQQKIAQFLDYETAKIDALIDEQKRLIELLKEKRQAVISHAVTKGLNPDAPMKDSGVEWLGEVPEHWKLTKLGYLGNAIIGLTYSPDDIIDEGGAIVLRSTNIQNGRVSLHDNVHVSKKISDKLRLRVGDILICSRNGSRALIGKNALIDESAAGHTFGAFTTVFRSTYNPFLRYIFDSRIFSAQAGLFMTTTVNQLTTGTLNQMQIALPPVNEQTEIIEYLDDEVMRVEFLTSECKLSLKLLQERRSALISAAVTGKIDVRDWQPPEGSDTVNSNASVQTERHYG